MRNSLADLNDYLFEQIERVNDDELKGEELKMQLQRSKMVCQLGSVIVQNAAVMVQGMKVSSEYGIERKDMPQMIAAKG